MVPKDFASLGVDLALVRGELWVDLLLLFDVLNRDDARKGERSVHAII